MLLEEMSEVQKPEFVYKYNQGDIFLAENRHVNMCTKNIDICHHFVRDMVEEKDMVIYYIRSKETLQISRQFVFLG